MISLSLSYSQDLAVICCQLGMEDAVDEIMQQLGADETGRISFEEFVRCRMQLINEIEQEHERCLVPASLLPPIPPSLPHGDGPHPIIPPLPPPRRPGRPNFGLGPLGKLEWLFLWSWWASTLFMINIDSGRDVAIHVYYHKMFPIFKWYFFSGIF